MLTTHSDYVIEQFNNFVRLVSIDSESLEEFGYSPNDVLNHEENSIYKVNEFQGKTKKTKLILLTLCQSERFEIRIYSVSTYTYIAQEVERLSIKSPEYIEMENENKKLNEGLESLKREICL